MGWSCRADAAKTMDKWTTACQTQTGKSNVFKAKDGSEYFWETSATEHADGAITGSVYKFLTDSKCVKSSTFRIEPNGTVTRAPAFLKQVAL